MNLVPVTGWRCLVCSARQHTRSYAPGRCCDNPIQIRILLDIPEGEPLREDDKHLPTKAELTVLHAEAAEALT